MNLYWSFDERYRVHELIYKRIKRKRNEGNVGSSNKELASVLDDQRGYSKEDKEWFVKEFQPYMSAYSRDAEFRAENVGP